MRPKRPFPYGMSDFAATKVRQSPLERYERVKCCYCPPAAEAHLVATIKPFPTGRASRLIDTRHSVPGYLHLVPSGHEQSDPTTRDSKVPSKVPSRPD
jgi:hypothetical protein